MRTQQTERSEGVDATAIGVTVRLFAMLKQEAGVDRVELDLPAGATVADAVVAVGHRAGLTRTLERMPLAHAVNREYAAGDDPLADGDELALIPPVSGGAPEPPVYARVTDEQLSADRVRRHVSDPRVGAVVVFEGVTREVDRLEYEAYAEMAEPLLLELLESVRGDHGLVAIAAEHRVGTVPLGEPSVIIAASAGHRPEAFTGARAAIDRIKSQLPIWKLEVERAADGAEHEQWVEGTPVGEVAR